MMRRIGSGTIVLVAASLFCSFCCAEDLGNVSWLTEYAKARRAGMNQDRLVLLMVTSDNCVYCVKMQDELTHDDNVVSQIHRNFVPAKLNLKMGDDLAQELKISIYPTTMIISPQGKILDYVRGYIPSNELNQRMSDALVEQNSIASAE